MTTLLILNELFRKFSVFCGQNLIAPMRALLLIVLLTTFSQFGRAQTLNVFMTTTDCSAYGVCDGTITMWVEGASAADSFMFLLDVAPAPVIYDTIIVSDTIVTLTGICPGDYTVTLDTLWGSCPNYPGGCCNCTGSNSCGGTAGAGASGTVGGPGPSLNADYTYTTEECFYSSWGGGCVYVNIIGQAPPFMVNINNSGWTPFTSGCMYDVGLYCGGPPPFVDVMDATGQVVSASLWGWIPPCIQPGLFIATPLAFDVCAGQQVVIPYSGSFDFVDWTIQSPTLGNMTGVEFSSSSGSISFIAPNSLSSEDIFVSLFPSAYTSFSICSGAPTYLTITVEPLPTLNPTDVTICQGDAAVLSANSSVSNISWSGGITDGVAFSPSATSTYTVTATSPNGCISTGDATVTVLPSPTVDAGTDQIVCEGDQVTLSASGATNYTWDNGISDNTAFTPTIGTTTYEVSATDANGCQSTDQVDVLVNPLPTVDAGTDQTACNGDQVTLSGSGGTSYVWDNGISNNTAFNPMLGTATYQVTGTDANGCQNTDQVDVLVNPLPTIDAGVDQVACDGDQVTLVGAGGISYTWDNGVTNGIAFTPPIGTTAYEVIGTDANGCQNTDQVDILVIPSPTIDAGVDQTVCEGDQVVLVGSGANTISWNNGVSDNIAFTPPLGTTTYQVTGTDANGCQNTDQVNVFVNALPAVDAGTDQMVCDGDQATLSGSGATSYVWDNGISNNTAFTPSLGTATYQVTGTDANGCQNTDQVDLVVNTLPTIDAGLDQTVCDGDQVALAGSGGTSYVWDNGVSDNVSFSPPIGSSTYQVTGTDANGCQNTDQVDILVIPSPTIDAGVDQTVCEGDQVVLVGSGANTISWDNGVSDNVAFIPSIGTTTYQVTGTDINGCQNTDQVDVTVNPLPIIDAGPDQTVCEGEQITLSGAGGVTYVWDFGVVDGIIFSPPAGTNVYTVVGTDVNGCGNTDEVTITVEPVPTVSFVGAPLEGCSPLDIELTNTSSGSSVDCIWTISDGTTLNGCGTVSTQLTEPGYYDVTLSISTLGGCFVSATYTDYIYIEPDPIAAFTFPTSDFTTLNPEVQFTNQSSGASSYWWDFNDNSTGTSEVHPSHLFPDEATTYIIDLTAYSDLGCIDSAQASILIQEELIYYVPNSFSPDGDQHNNVFEPVFHSGFDPYSFEMKIFNRWGEVIFTSNDATIGWDGTYLGKMVQDGVYTWTIKFKRKNNDEYLEDSGHVNLLR